MSWIFKKKTSAQNPTPAAGLATLYVDPVVSSLPVLVIKDETGFITTWSRSIEGVAPATPAAGTLLLYPKTDHTYYTLDSNAVERRVGPGTSLVTPIVAASAGINATETVVLSASIPANAINAGTTYRIIASGVCTSTVANVSNFRCRIGPTTLTGVIPAVVTPTAAASGTAIPFQVEIIVTVRTTGVSGTALGVAVLTNNGVTGVSAAASVVGQVTAAVTVNTTVANLLELTYQAAAATTTCTFHNSLIELVAA